MQINQKAKTKKIEEEIQQPVQEGDEIVLGSFGQGITLLSTTSAKGSNGYTTVIASKGIQEGCFYFEMKILCYSKDGNIRVGITPDCLPNVLEIPVGTDSKSYGFRCSDGYSFNNRQGIPYSHGLKEKDIVGFVVLLDAIDPPTTKETKISESLILTFINGDYCGIMYKGIPAQKYFAAVSLYREAEVSFNFNNSELNYQYLERIPQEVRKTYPDLEDLKPYSYVSKNQAELNYSYYKKM